MRYFRRAIHYSGMPRPPRFVLPGCAHHITQRGNYQQKVYFRAEDYQLYIDMLKEYSRHYGVAILGYCLMPNHVHLVAVPHQEDSFARAFRRLHSEYALALHGRLRRVGHLWQARYYSTPLDEEHFWATMLYVEQNPFRAGLVQQSEDWKWSSARAHLAGSDNGLLDLVRWRKRFTPEEWKCVLDKGLANAALLERIRSATTTGRPLGDEAFIKALEIRLGRRIIPAPVGRPPKKPAATESDTYKQLVLSAISA